MFLRKEVEIAVHAQLAWAFYRDPTSGQWVAKCDPLHITVSGDSEDATRQAAMDALQLLFTDLFESGELEAFLTANGWRTDRPLPKPDRITPRFQLPQFSFNRVHSAEQLLAGA